MGSQDSRQGRGHAALGYAVLIVYGSLYPFSGWVAARDPFAFLFYGWSATYVSPGDLATNVLAYVPLGLLVHRFLLTKAWGGVAAAFTVAAAFSLSLSMELLQAYLPTRTQSEFDLLTNTLGGALGVIAASLPGQRGRIVDMLRQARSNWFVPGRLADLGLIALAAWLLSRLMPLVTSLEVGKFQAALAPLVLGDCRSALLQRLASVRGDFVMGRHRSGREIPGASGKTGVCRHRDRVLFAPGRTDSHPWPATDAGGTRRLWGRAVIGKTACQRQCKHTCQSGVLTGLRRFLRRRKCCIEPGYASPVQLDSLQQQTGQ